MPFLWQEYRLTPGQYAEMQVVISLHDKKLLDTFILFHNRAYDDADTVARLEDKITKINNLLNSDKPISEPLRLTLQERKALLTEILYGDKPDEWEVNFKILI